MWISFKSIFPENLSFFHLCFSPFRLLLDLLMLFHPLPCFVRTLICSNVSTLLERGNILRENPNLSKSELNNDSHDYPSCTLTQSHAAVETWFEFWQLLKLKPQENESNSDSHRKSQMSHLHEYMNKFQIPLPLHIQGAWLQCIESNSSKCQLVRSWDSCLSINSTIEITIINW